MRVSGAAPGSLNPGTREGPRTNHPAKGESGALRKRLDGNAGGGDSSPGEGVESRGSPRVRALARP